jgi:hypothetical protein
VPHAGYIYSGHVTGAVFIRMAVPQRILDIHGEEATNDSDNLPGLCSTYDDTATEGRGKVYLRFENLPRAAGGPTLGPYPYVSSPREPRNGVACYEFSTSKSDRLRARGTNGRAVICP